VCSGFFFSFSLLVIPPVFVFSDPHSPPLIFNQGYPPSFPHPFLLYLVILGLLRKRSNSIRTSYGFPIFMGFLFFSRLLGLCFSPSLSPRGFFLFPFHLPISTESVVPWSGDLSVFFLNNLHGGFFSTHRQHIDAPPPRES